MPVLRAGSLAATWLPEDGMVAASFTHEGDELLGQRGGLDAYRANVTSLREKRSRRALP